MSWLIFGARYISRRGKTPGPPRISGKGWISVAVTTAVVVAVPVGLLVLGHYCPVAAVAICLAAFVFAVLAGTGVVKPRSGR